MAIPVMGNPGSKKRRRKSRKARRRSGMSRCALKLSRASRRQRRHARKVISGYKKSRRVTRRRHKAHRRRKSLYERYSQLLVGGGGKHREKRMAALKRRMEAVDRAKKTREYKKAARAEDKGLGYSFFGLNPRRNRMSRRRKSHRNPPSAAAGITAGLRPHNIIGVMPYLAGAIANGILRGAIGKRFSMVSSGLPGLALGIGTAGIVGLLGHQISGAVGAAMLDGALIETGSDAFTQIKDGKFGLSGGHDFDFALTGGTMSGMGDFAMPSAISAAQSTESTQSQYPMPAPGAHALPAAAPSEEHDAVGAMIADADLSSM